jgi:hypothetical protein
VLDQPAAPVAHLGINEHRRLDRQGKLRDTLNLRARITGSVPCERQVRDRLFSFYDWCAQHTTYRQENTPGNRTD